MTDQQLNDLERSRQRALEVRKEWMRLMGLPEDEIAIYCAPGEPADLKEEMRELEATKRLKGGNAPSYDQILQWAQRRLGREGSGR